MKSLRLAAQKLPTVSHVTVEALKPQEKALEKLVGDLERFYD